MTDSVTNPHKLLLRVALVHTACKSKPTTVNVWANGGLRAAETISVKRLNMTFNHTGSFNCDAIYGNALPGYAMLVGMKMTEEDVINGLKSSYPGTEFTTIPVVDHAIDAAYPKHASDMIAQIAADRTARHLLPLTPITSQYSEGSIDVRPYKEAQPSVQSEIPLPFASRLQIIEAEAQRQLKDKVKAPSIDLGQPQVGMYPGSPDTMAESQTATINNAPPAYIFFELEVNIDYDAETATFSARMASELAGKRSEDEESALAAIEVVNQKLKLDSLLVANGAFKGSDLPVKSPVVMPIRPPETTKGERKAEYDSWWTGVIKAYESLLTLDKTGDESEFNKWLLEHPGSNLQSYRTAIAAQASTASWANIASKLLDVTSGAASNVWDTITTWGPKEMVGAYGGFTAIEKAKELSPWIWAAGAGVLALIFLRK